jgi:hypothetical protein
MKDITEKFGGNFFVAAFVPALGFVALGMVVFGPIFPTGLLKRFQNPFFGQEWLTLLVLTVIIGFSLSSLNTFIYKIFEGYMLLVRLPGVRQRMQRQASRLQDDIQLVRVKLADAENRGESEEVVQGIRDDLYYRLAEYQQQFPRTNEAVLPTAFGNILRAAEDYPSERYSIDSVVLWPRFIHAMPAAYFDKVDQSNNGLGFLINCSTLSILTAVCSVFAAGYQLIFAGIAPSTKPAPDQLPPSPIYFVQITEAQFVYTQRVVGYLIFGVLMLVLAYLFYRATLPIARQYGNMIRSAYDLFRFELLKQFNLPLPQNLNAERDRWRQLSEFVAVGEQLGSVNFQYRFPESVKALIQETEEADSKPISPLPRRYTANKAKRSSASRAKRSKT